MNQNQKKQNSSGSLGLTITITVLAVALVGAIVFICVMLIGGRKGQTAGETSGDATSNKVQQEPEVDAETQALYDTIVMTVGDYEVDYETYRYYFLTGMESYDGGDKSFWGTSEGAAAMTKLQEEILEELRYHAAINNLCKEHNIALTEAELQEIEDSVSNTAMLIQMNYGITMTEMLSSYSMTLNFYKELTAFEQLASKLYEALTKKDGGHIDYSAEAVQAYADNFFHVRHILYGFSDGLSDEEAKAKAEETLETLLAIEDDGERRTQFDKLMAEGSNDYQADGDNFYYYTHGEMDEAFEAAVDEIAEGELSGVVKSGFGYHVILRLPLDLAFFEESVYPSYKYRDLVQAGEEGLEVKTTDFYATITPESAK